MSTENAHYNVSTICNSLGTKVNPIAIWLKLRVPPKYVRHASMFTRSLSSRYSIALGIPILVGHLYA